MATTFFRATHKSTNQWIIGQSTLSITEVIWSLIKEDNDDSLFIALLKDNPYCINWEEITEAEFKSADAKSFTDPLSFNYEPGKKTGKIPVALISEGSIENFKSVSELMKRLSGTISKNKIKKMLEDPDMVFNGFSIQKL